MYEMDFARIGYLIFAKKRRIHSTIGKEGTWREKNNTQPS